MPFPSRISTATATWAWVGGWVLSIGWAVAAGPIALDSWHSREFGFRSPESLRYSVRRETNSTGGARWLAEPVGGGRTAEVTARLLVRGDATALSAAREAAPGLISIRQVDLHTVILEAPDPLVALETADRLSRQPGVEAAVPMFRKRASPHYAFSPAPNDPYFGAQTYLESLDAVTGFPVGDADLRIRSAWPLSRGTGVTVAVVDDGVELSHPDLAPNRATGDFNFVSGIANGGPSTIFQDHGTAVAGIVAARGGNQLGMSGVAPDGGWVSWVIFDAVYNLPSDDRMAAMFEEGRGAEGGATVAVQNHSWGNSDFDVLPMSLVESLAISNAVVNGRGGLGTVFVRSAGNTRIQDYSLVSGVGDANLDAYAADPRQLTVAAVRNHGRVASYSCPGACIWVAAIGGDPTDSASPGLFTTDRTGAIGGNGTLDPTDPTHWDYLFGKTGFEGTSAAAPQVAGLAALILSLRPDLGWRDVQQLIALSSRQLDTADPGLTINGAGFRLSHNVGFGVPDAGVALRLARAWKARPPAIAVSLTNSLSQGIPDDGLRVVSSSGQSFGAAASVGRHPDHPTPEVPLYLSGSLPTPAPTPGTFGVFIPSTAGPWSTAFGAAATSGAVFALIAASNGTDDRTILPGTEFIGIPLVEVGRTSGDTLRAGIVASPGVRAHLELRPAEWTFSVTNALLLEHVQLTLNWQHPRMRDLRVTLESPSGTVSILHRPGGSAHAVPSTWTYGSAMHFGESSQGIWKVAVTDESPGETGSVGSLSLTLHGVPIVDTDADGLDDAWELKHFGNLSQGPSGDPDLDGWTNLQEQLAGSDPTADDAPLRVEVMPMPDGRLRLSWPGRSGVTYRVEMAADLGQAWTEVQSLAGRFPETGWMAPAEVSKGYFRIRQTP